MESIVQIVMGFIWWIVGFPIICLTAAPFILMVSCTGTGSYWTKVKSRFTALIEFWKENGMLLVP